MVKHQNPEKFNAFFSRVALKKERERSLSSDRPRSVYEKGSPPPRGSPDSLIATQAINSRTEKHLTNR
jgi:hypothetical protein